MPLKIQIWPEPALKHKCKEVAAVDDKIRGVLCEMYSLMKSKEGIGLAANQVGLDLQLVVMEVGLKVFKLVNPRVVKSEGQLVFREGCLSFPGIELDIKRAKRVWVSALDEWGQPCHYPAQDLLAVVFQHEIDHLRGIPFINRASFLDKVKLFLKLRKLSRR